MGDPTYSGPEMTTEDIIRKHSTPELLEEINDLYELAVWEKFESIKTFEDAFREISDRADRLEPGWEKLRTPTRRVHIALGEYVEMTQFEIENTMRFGGNRKPWDFKLGGKAYQWRWK